MNKKIVTTYIVALFAILSVNAQSGEYSELGNVEMDIRAGLGISGYEPQGKSFFVYEFELNKKFTPYFTVAPSIISNKVGQSDDNDTSLLQLNMNAFISPFRNNRRNDFRIGGGAGYSFLGLGYGISRNSFCANMIVENTFHINHTLFIGIKGFMQAFANKDNHLGLMLKIGAYF